MHPYLRQILWIATVAAVAIFVVSCKSRLGQAEDLVVSERPAQTVDDMFAVQTRNGGVVMRLEARVMEHYETDTTSKDTFPDGFSLYGYSEEGLLETVIIADDARHIIRKNKRRLRDRSHKDEIWEAFGNVVIHNVLKQETMETDTLYWDQAKQEIYTDCYVKMYSPDGFMQGYGMRSDDRARNAILQQPFNSYGVTVQDTTAVLIDSVNFIGPLLKK